MGGQRGPHGHRMPYYKPTVEHLEQEYLKAVPFLTVSEAEEAKKELTKEREENERKWKDDRLEKLELKEVIRGLQDRQNRTDRILEAVAEIPEVAAKLKAHAQG